MVVNADEVEMPLPQIAELPQIALVPQSAEESETRYTLPLTLS